MSPLLLFITPLYIFLIKPIVIVAAIGVLVTHPPLDPYHWWENEYEKYLLKACY